MTDEHSWGPAMSPGQALRLYGLTPDGLLALALYGGLRVEGNRVRLAAFDRAAAQELLAAALAVDRLSDPVTVLEREWEAGDVRALLDMVAQLKD